MDNPPQQSCDSCRFRKTKCDRGTPCDACIKASIRCKYAQTLRRKGPRRGKGRRLMQLKTAAELDKDAFEVFTPNTFSPCNENNSPKDIQRDGGSRSEIPESSIAESSATSPSWNKIPGLRSEDTVNAVENAQKLHSVLVAYIHAFVKYIFPIMPIVDTDDILADALRLNELPPTRYALIMLICATTRLQLNLESSGNGETTMGVEIPQDPRLTTDVLLHAAEDACRQLDFIDDLTVDSVVVSYFLFTVYASMEKLQHAWVHLNQSITLAMTLGLDYDASYANLPESERERGRRVFWILFVTERTFALQHRRPVRLRNCIAKPEVVNSDCPIVMNDLLNHISIFEVLPPALYEWHPRSEVEQPRGVALAYQINTQLCVVQATDSIIESQRFDTLITQQWLRVALWRLVFGEKPSILHSNGTLLPFSIPVDVGRAIMETLFSVSRSSMDCHGISIEQKLCDIGISLADSALAPDCGFSAFEIGPRDLLSVVVKSLSGLRGGQSHLLSKLLKHSEFVLGCGDPAAHVDFQWPLCNGLGELEQAVDEDSSRLVDEITDSTGWLLADDLGIGGLASL